MTSPQTARRPIAAVIGANSATDDQRALARALGAGLVREGFRIVTGGLNGVMEAASEGAKTAAGADDGRFIGVLPGLDASAANRYVDIVVPTGLNFARNVLVVAMADVVIAIGGGAGTLSELALAWQHQKPVIALDGGGWAAELRGRRLDGRREQPIHAADGVEHAIELATELATARSASRGF